MMVKVDEINDSISKFGQIVEGLQKVNETYEKVDEICVETRLSVEKTEEIMSNQKEMIRDVQNKMNELEVSLGRKVDDAKNIMRDRINNVELTNKVRHEELLKKFETTKRRQNALIVGAVIIIIFQIVAFII